MGLLSIGKIITNGIFKGSHVNIREIETDNV